MLECMQNQGYWSLVKQDKMLEGMQSQYGERAEEYKQLGKVIKGLSSDTPEAAAEVETVIDEELDGGSTGLTNNAGNLVNQTVDGFKQLFSIDGLKGLWNRAQGGDLTAWLPLLIGGAGLFFMARGLFGGKTGSLIGGALALAGGAWLAGGGLDTIQEWIGGKAESRTEGDAAKDAARAKKIADQAASNGVKAFDPGQTEHVEKFRAGIHSYGLKSSAEGILSDGLLKMSRGEPAGARFSYVNEETGESFNMLSPGTTNMMLGEMIRVDNNLGRDEYRKATHEIIRGYLGEKGDKLIATMGEYQV